MVDATSTVECAHLGMPDRRLDVVDRVSSAERLGAFELRITARSYDGACTKHCGELQTEQRNASSTLNEDRVASFEATLGHQRVPGSQTGTRQGGRFFIGQIRGRVNNALLVKA